jgi:hypothetical protein
MKKFFVIFILCLLSVLAGNISASILKNAVMVYYPPQNVWGFRGRITFREPNLAGGGAVYQRIIIYRFPTVNDPVERFIEIGWVKGFPGSGKPYVRKFGLLIIYGYVGSNNNEMVLFDGVEPRTYEYFIQHHRARNNIHCPGQNRFHTLSIGASASSSSLVFTICRSESKFNAATAISWGGETTAGSTDYLPDMVGSTNPRIANRYFVLQWAYEDPLRPSTIIWTGVPNGLARNDCPYSIIRLNSSYFTCGVEDGIRPTAVYDANIPCPRTFCIP